MLTFTRTFCRAANLKALLAQPGLSPVIDEIKLGFEQQYPNEFRGSTLNDVLSCEGYFDTNEDPEWNPAIKEVDLSPEVLDALKAKLNQDTTNVTFVTDRSQPGSLLEPTAQRLRYLKARGVTFSPAKQSEGNSSILFRPFRGDVIVAGQIQDIFLHATKSGMDGIVKLESFLVVKKFRPLSAEEEQLDPYRAFPLLDVRLYHDILLPEVFVITSSDIVSHFASCPFQFLGQCHQYRIVLSLDRVSLLEGFSNRY